MHIAASGGLVKATRLLLNDKNQRSISHKDGTDRQPLHFACLEGTVEIVEMLLEKGADIEAQARVDMRPLHDACSAGNVKAVDSLLTWKGKPAEPNPVDNDNWTPLYTAIYFQQSAVAEYLLQKVPDLHLETTEKHGGWTALHTAAHSGLANVVLSLLGKGADVNARDGDGWTPPLTAVYGEDLKVMATLLDTPSTDGRLNQILEYTGGTGARPLHIASARGFEDGAELLLSRGAELSRKDEKGQIALDLALENDLNHVIHYIVENILQHRPYRTKDTKLRDDKMRDKVLLWACEKHQRHDVAKVLLSRLPLHATAHAQPDTEHWGVIEWAAYRGLPHILYLLLATTPRGSARQSGIDSARDRLTLARGEQKGKSTHGPDQKQTEGKVTTVKQKSKEHGPQNKTRVQDARDGKVDDDPVQSDYDVVHDILQNPDLWLNTDGPRIRLPVARDECSKFLALNAAIIQIIKTKASSAAIPRFRQVKEVIYGIGPGKIPREANSKLEKLMKWKVHGSTLPSMDQLGSEFTWVHLPSTNVSLLLF